ncbi:MAG: hypothetical protein ABH883_00475 [Candidatus Omnitrophota bacterium]
MRFIKTLLGVLLLPVLIATGKEFFRDISGIGLLSNTLHVLERGALVYLFFHVMIIRPVYIYVLGHEFVHALATWVCGGRVESFNVTPGGGNVVTSKTNFFIELSPYFVPIYTIFLGFIYFILRLMDKEIPFMSTIFVFCVGVTMAFHFVMTSEILRIEQPDVLKSGFLFSLVIIFLANMLIIVAVFCPIFDNLSFVSFIKGSAAGSAELYREIYGRIVEFFDKLTVAV